METNYTPSEKHTTNYEVVPYIHENGITYIEIQTQEDPSLHMKDSKLLEVIKD